MDQKIDLAFAQFDSYNQQDPNRFSWAGETFPQEYFLSLKLCEWVKQLDPAASEPLLLASRSQHIGRWESPRESYPMDREGYLRWRKELAQHHASVAARLLADVGYDQPHIEEVTQIILKKKIKVNSDVQTIENALCLVFLQYQYEAFFTKYEDKIVNILRKSLLKMDAHGHSFALRLPYSERGLHFIQLALASLSKENEEDKTA